ncbi:MAG: sulfatase-like hydrolase/transferase, partial [Deltaproteobacteria bacterium]|nr:sulfatase-like hydrolase/transferase [Deltaproteobacteria bacterium]
MLISCAFQIAHAFFACLSFHLLLILGGMIDRALIDLTFFNQDAGEPFTGVLSDSISIYITPGRVAMTASCVALPLALLFLLRRFDFRYSRRARALFVSVSLLLISITWFLVPGLSSGRLIGTRILSYGLERSALAEFIYSYARPVMESFIEPEYELGDDFRFSHGIEPPDGASEKPPVFEGASPLKTNVVLVVMESISAEYLEKDTDGKMPFLRSLLSSGVYLQRHYAHWGQTMKSLFSILCSEYPYPGHRPETDINLAIPCVSLIERLHSAGYYTSIFQSGDSNFDRMKSFFKARGVDEYYDMSNMPGSENCWRNSWGIDEKVTVDAILEWAQDFGKGGKGERFFIMYILSAGHHPYTYPGMENIRVESDRDAYDGTLSYVDGRLKTLVNGLAGKGMTE